ncbi:hypothetical protein [Vibrio splendidus]|uniref:hypothetical protein n=1 Tax=Vibrio splendidus TaxID=29497 RepID=UPI001C06D928|nr:hypothetical protein [Vibrio splendidus]MBU2910039.1 hypothetical protein [Vibrio splendidus]MDO6531412.1 hypothetical protein [Vibrio splendidus]MDO6552660.1 hypothetical protein [Vibrio splendidus]
MEQKYYWPIDNQTQEVLVAVKARFKGGCWHMDSTALQIEPLPSKEGFAVIATFDENGRPIGSTYIEDNRDKTVYDQSNCIKSEKVTELGLILDGWTLEEPKTKFDEWIDDAWVTNKSNQHIAEYNQVDNVRRSQYVQMCDPLFAEANIKRLQGFEDDARAIEAQALAARDKIQTENPWPTPPAN